MEHFSLSTFKTEKGDIIVIPKIRAIRKYLVESDDDESPVMVIYGTAQEYIDITKDEARELEDKIDLYYQRTTK